MSYLNISNSGKNIWKISYTNDYGIEEKSKEVMYHGYYDDALKKFNKLNISTIKIKPISHFHYEDTISNNHIDNCKESLKKTLNVISEMYKPLITEIEKNINHAIKNGHCFTIFILEYNKKKDNIKKINYFYEKLGNTVSYNKDDRILKISW